MVVIAVAITASVLWARSRVVVVPDVSGLPLEIAQRALEVSGLSASVSDTRVSVDVAEGSVLSQDPMPGAELRRGETVTLVVSAGPQTFPLPDVLGMQLEDARVELVSKGLVVNVVGVSAEASSGVVVEMYPSPGTSVNTGDAVRLSVPGGSEGADMLLPYDLTGVTVVLDPSPPETADPGDPAIDVARRLNGLLQAAGAVVTMTRSATDTAPVPEARLQSAQAAGADVLIGIDVGRTGEPGLRVLHRPAQDTAGDALTASRELASAITRAARLPGIVVLEPGQTSDPVLVGFTGPGVRVTVGDVTAEADRVRMTDPAWADSVARSIYRGVGTRFATR